MSRRKKKHLGSKRVGGGEAKKQGKTPHVASQESKAALADAQDGKRGNIGPSGQGTHRGRERRNKQAAASGRSDIPSIGTSKRRRADAVRGDGR